MTYKTFATALAICLASVSAPSLGQATTDFRAEFPPQYTDTPLGVNLQTGKFRYWLYDFDMGPFQLKRGFNQSGFQFAGSLYWSTKVTAGGGQMSVVNVSVGDTKLQFVISGTSYTGAYLPWNAAAMGWKLERSGSGHQLTDKSGNTYYFSDYGTGSAYPTPSGRITKTRYANGLTFTITLNANGGIQSVRSSNQYALGTEIIGSTQVKICGFNIARAYYQYNSGCSTSPYVVTLNGTTDTSGNFIPSSVTDAAGQTSYIYYTGSQYQCITKPNSSQCEFNNVYGDLPGEVPHARGDQVRRQTDALGRVYEYDYVNPSPDDPQYPGGPPLVNETNFALPGSPMVNGVYPFWAHFENGLLKAIQAPGGGPNQFEYNGVELKKVTYPEGNSVTINRDAIGNPTTVVETPKPGSSLSPTTRTQVFPTSSWSATSICDAASPVLCDKPTQQIDALGRVTDYTYDATHGGVLTKTLPPDSNGIRPQIRYEYTLRPGIFITATGAWSSGPNQIWVKTRERFCKTSATINNACAAGTSDEVVTDYEYGPVYVQPNNLLLRGIAVTADGQTRRTCYSYDDNGRKISETQPEAGLGVCP